VRHEGSEFLRPGHGIDGFLREVRVGYHEPVNSSRGKSAVAGALVLVTLVGCNGASEAPMESEVEDQTTEMTESDSTVREEWIEFGGTRLWSLSAGPEGGPLVLLLHGGRFSSKTWRELGTIDLLAQAGLRVLAIDLPGYGASPATELPRAELLHELIASLGPLRPVVVSPSMSGGFSLPLAIDHPRDIAGYAPVAPAGIETYRVRLPEIRVPTLIVWGSADSTFPLQQGQEMAAAIEGARLFVLEGAPHACYLSEPDLFHRALIDFVREVSAP